MSEEICKNCKYHFIEEISFDNPQSCCNKENIIGTTELLLHCKDFEYSKDYIVDLQQENKQLKEDKKKAIEYNKENKKFANEVENRYAEEICKNNLKILGDKE